jgi:hypothetical protein
VNGPPTESRSIQWSDNWGQQARRLLKPEEVTNLPSRTAITFTPGIPPIMTTLIRYYEENLSGRGRGVLEKSTILGMSAFFLLIGIGSVGWVSEFTAGQGMTQSSTAVGEFGEWDDQPVKVRRIDKGVRASRPPRHMP